MNKDVFYDRWPIKKMKSSKTKARNIHGLVNYKSVLIFVNIRRIQTYLAYALSFPALSRFAFARFASASLVFATSTMESSSSDFSNVSRSLSSRLPETDAALEETFEEDVRPPPIIATTRQSIPSIRTAALSESEPESSTSKRTFGQDMRVMLDSMKMDSKRMRAENKAAVKYHRDALAKYNSAVLGQKDRTTERKRREKALSQRRSRVMRYESELQGFYDQLIKVAESGRVPTSFFDTAEAKYEDLLREKEALCRDEVELGTFLIQKSKSDFSLGILQVDEMRKKLRVQRLDVGLGEKDDEISGVEKITKTWIEVKNSLDYAGQEDDETTQVSSSHDSIQGFEKNGHLGFERMERGVISNQSSQRSANGASNWGKGERPALHTEASRKRTWLEYFGLPT